MDVTSLVNSVEAFLIQHIKPEARLTIGLSGGLDSVVLLTLVHSLQNHYRFQLTAHHINHQISPHADEWSYFCLKLCNQLKVPFSQTGIIVSRKEGKGLEAAARLARYAAFKKLDTDYLLLAHHQDDQVETMLLRLFRGAGVKGMAAMAECSSLPESTITLLRPLLHAPRTALHNYAQAHSLEWITDESNANSYYMRNFFRNDVFPILEKRFPSYRLVLDRASQQFAESSALLDELAQADSVDAIHDKKLSITRLQQLNEARAKNLLRFFLSQHHLKMPDHKRMREFIQQLRYANSSSEICFVHDAVELRVFQSNLHLVKPLRRPSDLNLKWNKKDPKWVISELHGAFIFEQKKGEGLSSESLENAIISVRLRQGGEKIRLGVNRPQQKLKNIMQECNIPPWERERLPLIFINEKLAYVPGVGVDIEFACVKDSMGFFPVWESSI